MLPELTDRENQILKLIANGSTNREISGDISVTSSTFHRGVVQ